MEEISQIDFFERPKRTDSGDELEGFEKLLQSSVEQRQDTST
jgi:hypothetical protein